MPSPKILEGFSQPNAMNKPCPRQSNTVKYLPYRLLTLGLDASYFETNTPSELVATTGLQLARTRATETNVTPSVSYQLTTRDLIKSSYTYTFDTLEGGLDNTTHTVRLGYSRQLTSLDTGSINYRLHIFETQQSPTTITNTPTLGWTRQLTPNTVLSLEAGPRFVDNGSLEPEAHARLEYTYKLAKFAIDYLRSEAVVIGLPGKVELENVTALVEVEPVKLLKVRFEPGYYRTFDGVEPAATVYGFLLSAIYPIKSWLSAHGYYHFAYQKQGGENLSHNVVGLSLDVVYPMRVSP